MLVQEYLQKWGVWLLEHLNSPDLAAADFFLIQTIVMTPEEFNKERGRLLTGTL
jgi:hypothetical protein